MRVQHRAGGQFGDVFVVEECPNRRPPADYRSVARDTVVDLLVCCAGGQTVSQIESGIAVDTDFGNPIAGPVTDDGNIPGISKWDFDIRLRLSRARVIEVAVDLQDPSPGS